MYPRRSRRKPLALLLFPALFTALVLLVLSLAFSPSARAAAISGEHVDVATLDSDISPASLHYLTGAITTAESDGANALVVEINTPGGDLGSMESMKVAELNSTVPVISYVSPMGG